MTSFKDLFQKSCKRTCEGAGVAAVAHIGCLSAPVVSGAFGSTLSHSFMMASMYVTSPLIAMGITWAIDHYRGVKTNITKLLSSAAIALAVSFAINQYTHHNEHQEWFEQQSPEMQDQLKQNADMFNMSLEDYIESFCITPTKNDASHPSP